MITKKVDVSPLRVNESSALRPRDLSRYIENPSNAVLTFTASLASGAPLPSGIECTQDGRLHGTPDKNTADTTPYSITINVKSDDGDLTLDTQLWIFPVITTDDIKRLHQEAWQTIAQGGDMSDSLKAIVDRPVTEGDIFYLLERYATFIVWNADDMRLAKAGKPVTVQGISDKFNVYDFDVCLVAAPTNLYDEKRVLTHAVDTARAMLREAHSREWNVEFGGFDRMAQAAYYEANKLNAQGGHKMEVRNYQPVAIQKGSDEAPRHEIE